MLIDNRVIARQSAGAGGLEVLAQRHEVMWRDGTAVVLHPVYANGLPMPLLRAVATTAGALLLVDLARLHRPLDGELRACPARDVPGHLFYTLRSVFGSAAAFLAAAQRHSPGTWLPVAGAGGASLGHTWQAAPRQVCAETLALAELAARQPASPATGARA